MSCRELQMWKAYGKVEPFGEQRADLRAAYVAANVVAAMTGTRQKVSEYMLDFDKKPTRQQSVEEMQARVMLAVKIAEKEKRNG